MPVNKLYSGHIKSTSMSDAVFVVIVHGNKDLINKEIYTSRKYQTKQCLEKLCLKHIRK